MAIKSSSDYFQEAYQKPPSEEEVRKMLVARYEEVKKDVDSMSESNISGAELLRLYYKYKGKKDETK